MVFAFVALSLDAGARMRNVFADHLDGKKKKKSDQSNVFHRVQSNLMAVIKTVGFEFTWRGRGLTSVSSRLGMVNVEWIQQYVSMTLPGTPSTMQSMGSPIYWRDVTTSEKPIKMITVAWARQQSSMIRNPKEFPLHFSDGLPGFT